MIEGMQAVIQLATFNGTLTRRAEEGHLMQQNKSQHLIDAVLSELWQQYLAATPGNLFINNNCEWNELLPPY